MKKIMLLLFTIVCIAGLLTACGAKSSNKTMEFALDADGNYTGFINIPTDYTIEDAQKDGYFVRQGLDVVANSDVWDNYIEAASRGNNTSIRIVGFFEENINEPYFVDIFFNDGYYYLFDNTAESQEKEPFLYLLELEGKAGIPEKDCGAVILTNDNTLTFDDVMTSMLSSDLETIQSISPYRLVMLR